MAQIQISNPMPGSTGSILPNAGAPVAGTNEVQTLTFGGTGAGGDTFPLSFKGYSTGPIAWSATNATLIANIDTALEALGVIGTGGVTTAAGSLTAGIGTVTVTFTGQNASLAVPTLVVGVVSTTASLTVTAAETTPGVTATYRGAGTGTQLNDTTNGVAYINTGTSAAPVWTKVGVQT